jgi:transcription elongation factor Elf1
MKKEEKEEKEKITIDKDTDFSKLKRWPYKYYFICTKCGKESHKFGQVLKRDNRLLCMTCQASQTSFERTGSYSVGHDKAADQKRKQTNQKKFGGDSPFSSADVRKKRDQVYQDRFGGHPFKNVEVRKKIEQTNLEKYGVENPFYSKDNQEAFKKIKLEKYGDAFYNNKEKAINTNSNKSLDEKDEIIKKIRATNIATKKEQRIQRFSKIDFSTKPVDYFIRDGVPYFKCKKCGDTWEAYLEQKEWNFRCFKCKPIGSLLVKENEFASLLDELNLKYKRRVRSLLPRNKELDFYFPDHKIAVEFDGVYWHSEGCRYHPKDWSYHLTKTEECVQQGIRLIHVFETSFRSSPSLVKSYLQSVFNQNQEKIFARKTTVGKISEKDYGDFCNENHLQGSTPALIKLGLFYQNELVQVMSFSKPRYNKNYEWEMIRECSKQNTRVIGGKGKLLKYFEKNYNPKSLISYCDRRWFTGESYLKLDFKLEKTTPPGYWYFKSNRSLVLLNRINFMKHKLSKIQGFQFDNNLTEWENMQLNGYNRIWDCGQLVFVKNY